MAPEWDTSHLLESDSKTAYATARRWQMGLLIAVVFATIVPFLVSAAVWQEDAAWAFADYLTMLVLALGFGNIPIYFLSSWGRTKLLDSWPDVTEIRTWNDYAVTRSALNGAAVTLLLLTLGGYCILAAEAPAYQFTGSEVLWLSAMIAFELFMGPLGYFIGFCLGQGWTIEHTQ